MKYYRTSPEYVKIKVAEAEVESSKRDGRLEVAMALVLIVGMTLGAVTAYNFSKSTPIFDFFNKKSAMKTQEAQKSSFKPPNDDGKFWSFMPFNKIIIVHIYNPSFEGESEEEFSEVEKGTETSTTSPSRVNGENLDYFGVMQSIFETFNLSRV